MSASAPVITADAVVVGAGPAGAAFALNLAPFQRVLLLEKRAAPVLRPGESLPGAARRLLHDMGLWDAFLNQGHRPCHLIRSTWGGNEVLEQDAMRDLDGHGWYLDRARFEGWLQHVAQERGAALLTEARLLALTRTPDSSWQLNIQRQGKPLTVRARLLVDAAGRSSSVTKRLGGKRRARDKLVCGWLYGRDTGPDGADTGMSHIHAEMGGWWYSSPLPGSEKNRILAFYTDADLPQAASAHNRENLVARLAAVPELWRQLNTVDFTAGPQAGFCTAHSANLDSAAGDGWLAIGDAALAFDPLSSQGLFNSLYTGLAGAEAAQQFLQGASNALAGYNSQLANIQHAYLAHLEAWYGQETRWIDQPFWQRRQGGKVNSTGGLSSNNAGMSSTKSPGFNEMLDAHRAKK
ncbi:Dehydrogenase (flavoprotein) [Nitrosospira sp. Nl5]|uniref:NAD(P)/FAD-dependent oxidoreductase n=1 Tax=Nitrosospira sp. Nl5 TaxID=200120 RepID=UPI00088D8EB9|nr:FAD-dependent monooxygenase [Nitrosospira sp. Nl5]SCY57227.1 Dehydrogenase (flavoprotein) [Nitrosospira sp. Nl5]